MGWAHCVSMVFPHSLLELKVNSKDIGLSVI